MTNEGSCSNIGKSAREPHTWSSIEVVITGTTGNRVYPKRVPRVQIPPAPPEYKTPSKWMGFCFIVTICRNHYSYRQIAQIYLSLAMQKVPPFYGWDFFLNVQTGFCTILRRNPVFPGAAHAFPVPQYVRPASPGSDLLPGWC